MPQTVLILFLGVVQDYTNNDIGLAVLNQMTINPVLITIIDVINIQLHREASIYM